MREVLGDFLMLVTNLAMSRRIGVLTKVFGDFLMLLLFSTFWRWFMHFYAQFLAHGQSFALHRLEKSRLRLHAEILLTNKILPRRDISSRQFTIMSSRRDISSRRHTSLNEISHRNFDFIRAKYHDGTPYRNSSRQNIAAYLICKT